MRRAERVPRQGNGRIGVSLGRACVQAHARIGVSIGFRRLQILDRVTTLFHVSRPGLGPKLGRTSNPRWGEQHDGYGQR